MMRVGWFILLLSGMGMVWAPQAGAMDDQDRVAEYLLKARFQRAGVPILPSGFS